MHYSSLRCGSELNLESIWSCDGIVIGRNDPINMNGRGAAGPHWDLTHNQRVLTENLLNLVAGELHQLQNIAMTVSLKCWIGARWPLYSRWHEWMYGDGLEF